MSRVPVELPALESVPSMPVAPTVESWCAMTPQQREAFLVSAIEASSLVRRSRLNKGLEELKARAEEASRQAEQAVVSTRETILALLVARGLPCPDEVIARVKSCDDLSVLLRWLQRAATAATAPEVVDT